MRKKINNLSSEPGIRFHVFIVTSSWSRAFVAEMMLVLQCWTSPVARTETSRNFCRQAMMTVSRTETFDSIVEMRIGENKLYNL